MRRAVIFSSVLVFAVLVFLIAPFIGSTTLSLHEILNTSNGNDIFLRIRLPRVILGFLCGSALAVTGLSFQAIFRNPLATPFTLGVSSGASLGAALSVRLGISFAFLSIDSASLFAFVGAGLAIVLVYGITRAKGGLSTATMLLAGVAVTFCFTSLILFIQYTSNFAQAFEIVRWLMGGLETVGFDSVLALLPFIVIGTAALAALSHEFNLMTAGEDIATSRGVNTRRVKRIVFIAASLMIGAVVSICGPIGFVGMMAPHILRLLIGVEHRLLVPAAIAFGGAFLAVCDTIARTVIAPAEMPVGIITAMIGGPFFLWLLISSNPQHPRHADLT
ncbi:MAG: iron ABC transporter permease [Myxococcota bacterium]|nr:iron ABC transporter permease [Myxococcota bacterium]